ncbi:MAG: hypothetical protein C3F07_19810 [Anaerolineales bacterium]|nr:twin-arginine translocase TatA/TatE family subunit [Anaerolineae bacterium]PWB69486.1 MAG: hypothetical protein C3F07_19810 [Anaerolineales bacterium]
MNKRFAASLVILLLSAVACQPIFAIGWREILLVVVIAAFLLGPPLYRFFRRLENYRRQKDK